MILIDYTTISQPEKRKLVKEFVTEHVINHPDTLITVVNAKGNAQLRKTRKKLRGWAFPFDGVACNPLAEINNFSIITFKTMFAANLLDRDEHKVVLVIDDDVVALEMWKSVGVKFTLAPELVEDNNG